MHKKSFLYFFIFCLIISLSGCGTSNADSTPTDVATSVSETFSETTADTTATENKNEMVASSEPTANPKAELTIPDLPDDFIECTKYIGQNISEIGLNQLFKALGKVLYMTILELFPFSSDGIIQQSLILLFPLMITNIFRAMSILI